MAKIDFRASVKHLQIDKANTMVLIATAVTTAIVVFSLVATQTLYKQLKYQNKVISMRNKANKQLVSNIKAIESLGVSYKTFDNASESIIGTSDKNSTIILNALPSKYDFPALTTSIEKIIVGSGAKVTSITGSDNEAAAEQNSINPTTVEIPFQITANGSYATIQKLITDIQRSIRPIKIISVTLSGSDNNMQCSISAVTYYQPSKSIGINEKLVPETDKNSVPAANTSKTTSEVKQ
jgi:Tfp pilus assembly protein PilO